MREPPPCNGYLLAACWFGTWFVFWSICKTKLPHYLLPAYPALALLVACWIDRWLADPATVGDHWLPKRLDLDDRYRSGHHGGHPDRGGLRLAGRGPFGVGRSDPRARRRILLAGNGTQRASKGGRRVCAMSVVFLTAVFGFAVLRVDRHQNAKPMIAAIHADWQRFGGRPARGGGRRAGTKDEGGKARDESPDRRPSSFIPHPSALPPSQFAPFPPIATFGPFRESTVFYAGHPVTQCSDRSGNRPQGPAAPGRFHRGVAPLLRRYQRRLPSRTRMRRLKANFRSFSGSLVSSSPRLPKSWCCVLIGQ